MTYSKQIKTPFGCILVAANSGRCRGYHCCEHAAECLRLSLDLAGGGFKTKKEQCPGYKLISDDPETGTRQNADYDFTTPYSVHY